ncbi:MFS transporter [Candidatus Saccharibacteria bacterium]|nr:MFS transporter [Candidatus Saccharibacteria bacterium]
MFDTIGKMSHSLGLSHYHIPRMQEMGRLYWCHSVGIFGIQLAAIFVPIYLLKIDYSFKEVLVFLLTQQLFAAILQYPITKLFALVSPHYLLGFGRIWLAVFFFLLSTLQIYNWPLFILAFFWALDRTMYWTAFHYVFGKARAHKTGNRQIAGINALAILAATVAPAVGGIVASSRGINYVYIISILLIITASLPIMFIADKLPKVKLNITKKLIKNTGRDLAANAFNGTVIVAEQSLWPIFVFLIVSSYAGIGILSSVIAIASAWAMIYVGKKEETKGERFFIGHGVTAYGIVSFIRTFAENAIHVFGLNLFAGIGRSLYVTPFMNRYYTNSDSGQRLSYIMVMETAFSIGSLTLLLILIMLLSIFTIKTVLSIGLVSVAFLVLGVRLIR